MFLQHGEKKEWRKFRARYRVGQGLSHLVDGLLRVRFVSPRLLVLVLPLVMLLLLLLLLRNGHSDSLVGPGALLSIGIATATATVTGMAAGRMRGGLGETDVVWPSLSINE